MKKWLLIVTPALGCSAAMLVAHIATKNRPDVVHYVSITYIPAGIGMSIVVVASKHIGGSMKALRAIAFILSVALLGTTYFSLQRHLVIAKLIDNGREIPERFGP